jgi:DNA mismatch endonuclease, patch repair protein
MKGDAANASSRRHSARSRPRRRRGIGPRSSVSSMSPRLRPRGDGPTSGVPALVQTARPRGFEPLTFGSVGLSCRIPHRGCSTRFRRHGWIRSGSVSLLPTAPDATSPAVRAVMQGNRARDTRPEVALRSELHRRGLRFRKHAALEPGLRFRPDVVFPRQQIAIECLGCFWHRCPVHGVSPTTNAEYWQAKLDRNVDRDRRNAAALAAAGWQLVVVWEHEDPVEAADRIEQLVRAVQSHT